MRSITMEQRILMLRNQLAGHLRVQEPKAIKFGYVKQIVLELSVLRNFMFQVIVILIPKIRFLTDSTTLARVP